MDSYKIVSGDTCGYGLTFISVFGIDLCGNGSSTSLFCDVINLFLKWFVHSFRFFLCFKVN